MAATKVRTSIWAAQVLTASAGPTTSSWVDLSGGYGAQLDFRLTNGTTGPTTPAQVQVQVANNWNAGSPTLAMAFGGPMVGDTNGSNFARDFSVEIPPGVAAVRLIAGQNVGGSNVTVDADVSNITAL
jgi:hypothetical protein